ncbi:peptidoglycan bridge formation glycyltransferase FemA/FemB family protein [Patescibacteria group bacterium]|nr:MAG: peptidoglycan bridge formation glycyltransferase FemA/FemB family protein [Patescibacteria group bacterium]
MLDGMNQRLWNAFVAERGPRSGAFLQSWEWGTFQESLGRKVVRRGDLKEWAGQFVESKLPFGLKYLYCPKGPVGTMELEGLGELKGSPFVRIEPSIASTDRRARRTIDVQPSHTLITDLTKGTDELLAGMHEKTRYNIRLAERKGVECSVRHPVLDDEVWALFKTTGSRGGFRLHDRAYYEAMLKNLSGETKAFLAVARFEGKVIAANVMVDFGRTRTYLHGASSDEHRNVMAPFLLHWKLIEDAKAKGIIAYDWWGVAPEGALDSHPWAGITRFKLGFGGERVDSPGTFDLVLDPLRFGAYRIARAVRRI